MCRGTRDPEPYRFHLEDMRKADAFSLGWSRISRYPSNHWSENRFHSHSGRIGRCHPIHSLSHCCFPWYRLFLMLNNPHRFATVASGCSVGAALGRLLMHSAKIAIIPLSSQRDSNVSQIKVHFQTGRCCCRGNCFIISRLSFTGEKTPVRNGFGFRIVLPH